MGCGTVNISLSGPQESIRLDDASSEDNLRVADRPESTANANRAPSGSIQAAYTGIKLAISTFRSKPHADVLRRVFDLTEHGMTPALAEGILALDFPEEDAVRIGELNARANEGALTDDEQAELEAYINVSDLLAYWQSKARQAVQSHT
jgi:hypothetical protein